MRDGPFLRREEWEVVVIVNTTNEWSFYSIVQIMFISFSTDFLYVKILALRRGFSSFFCLAKANQKFVRSSKSSINQ